MLFRASQAFIKQISCTLVAIGMVGFSSSAFAAKSEVPQSIAKSVNIVFDAQVLSKKVQETIGLTVIKASPSSFPGVAEIITDQGLFYTSFDGQYFIQGTMFNLGSDTVINVTEKTMTAMRVEGLQKFENDMITYKAENEKHVITVFTDITCGYCRKMHEQMDEYNALGITIRYLAYPREGIMDRAGRFTKGFQDLRSIWCHEDPQTALTKAKSGMGIAQRICNKPVADEFNFARQVGVNATPAIVLANGDLRPGYVPPSDLIEYLDNL